MVPGRVGEAERTGAMAPGFPGCIGQSFSHLHVPKCLGALGACLPGLVKWRGLGPPPPRVCISSELPGDTAAVGCLRIKL